MLSSVDLSPDSFKTLLEKLKVTNRTGPFYGFKSYYYTFLSTAALIAHQQAVSSPGMRPGVVALTLPIEDGAVHIVRRLQTIPQHHPLDVVVIENKELDAHATFSGSFLRGDLGYGLQGFAVSTVACSGEPLNLMARALPRIFTPWKNYCDATATRFRKDSDRLDQLTAAMRPIDGTNGFWDTKIAPYFREANLIRPACLGGEVTPVAPAQGS